MILMCFHALVRKMLPVRPLQTASRPGGRRGARLRLEMLEDRMVTTASSFELPELLADAPAVRVAAVSSHEIEVSPVDPASAVTESANTTVFRGPALQRLLEDIRKLET